MRIASILVLAGACTAYDPSLPTTPFFCGTTEPKCPEGYTCMPSASGKSVCTTGTEPPPSGSCTMAFSGVLATWSLASEPGSQVSTPATSNAAGVTASSLTRAPALMAATGTGSINATNWPTASMDTTKYFSISVGPPSGCTLDLTSLAIDVKSSATGPTNASVATSKDAFGQVVTVSTAAPSTPALTVTSATAAIEIRIYGYGATAASGTMRIQNDLTVSGALH